MCGIAGFFVPHHSIPETTLERMTRCVAHRGPDAEGYFSDQYIGFGHRRLSIIDLSDAANQPMCSMDGRWVMMFNGEVFNFKELANTLNIPWQTHSDTEVMLELFAAFGPQAVTGFNGMFAIALYDKIDRSLYLFRDRLGVKPLFYFIQGDHFFFSSEIKSLTAVEEIKQQLTINMQAVSLFLQLGYIPEPHTIWNEIKKFPAGCYSKLNSAEFNFHHYWKAEDKITAEVITDQATAKENLRELLESAVRYRMIADVPFGIFLSGGIDSSLVAAIAQRESSLPVKTFTIGFREQNYNEAPYAREIAVHLKTNHQEFLLDYNDALQLCDSTLDAFDEPFADSSAIPTALISMQARQEVKMVLTGDGGDELFMGYGMYRWAERLHHPLIKIFRKPIGASLSMLSDRYKRASALFRYSAQENLQQHIFSQEQYLFSEREGRKLLGDKFINDRSSTESKISRKLTAAEEQSFYDLQHYLKDDLLVKVDRASMRYGLECRTPFLDYRIVEFALNVSQGLKMKNGCLKILPRQLLADYFPESLFNRNKQGFAIPLKLWLKKELRHLVDQYLSEEMIRKHGIINYKEVEILKQKFFGGVDHLYNRLWNLIVLHRWLEMNIN